MPLANVIFPAYQAPYLSWGLVPISILALLAELAILRVANRNVSFWKILACIVGMNVVSTAIGVVLVPVLFVDAGLVWEPVLDDSGKPVVSVEGEPISIFTQGPEFGRLSMVSFVQAGILSMFIETAALLPFRRSLGLRRVALPVAAGNLASYLILFAAYAALFLG